MRISLLLNREPFPEIIESTLAKFWRHQHGREFRVRWQPDRANSMAEGEQAWICNHYLNAIFQTGVDPVGLDPIRKEFSRSPQIWKRPLQRLYVSLATGTMAKRLSQSRLVVFPRVPDSQHLVIIPGNQKIRILDHRSSQSTCLLKDGFSRCRFETEISARRLASEHGVCVPELHAVELGAGWYSEQYVCGIPHNRLGDPQIAEVCQHEATDQLQRLITATQSPSSVAEYAGILSERICSTIDRANQLNPHIRQAIRGGVRDLLDRVCAYQDGSHFVVAQTHGDFQSANILWDGAKTWVIDWENSGTRQASYDLFVLATNSRIADGLAQRLHNFVNSGIWPCGVSAWPGLNWNDQDGRTLHAELFLLEELDWHVQESCNELFNRESEGLKRIINELKVWLAMKK